MSNDPLLSSGDYNSDELARLLELQRRQGELRNPDMDEFVLDSEDDDFSITEPTHRGLAATIPDMRFEKQFDTSVEKLRAEGSSTTYIIWSAVVVDQIIMPFITGFVWSFGASAFKWYKTRGVVNKATPGKYGFWRGITHGISQTSQCIYNSVARNASFVLTTAAQTIEAATK